MTFNEALFWRRVDKTDTCWLWTGYINREGYGEYRSDMLTTRLAHRIAYALDNGGELPELPLDHLCRSRNCVNPDHLEPVTVKANTARSNVGVHESNKTHCPHGHEYDEENTLHYQGKRVCRACKNERARESRRHVKNRQAEAPPTDR